MGFASCLRYRSREANRTLHDIWPSPALVYYICIVRGSCPQTEFCHLQNSLFLQVLHSPILTALLHGTRAVAISQTLWCGTRNGITKLSQRVPPIFGWVAITLGIGQHSSLSYYNTGQLLTNDRLATLQFSTLLWPPTVMGRPLYFAAVVFIFLLLFFLAYSQLSEIGCLPYFHTWRGLSADLECMSKMCCTQLAENTGRKNYAKKSPSAHRCRTLLGYIFATKACINNWKKTC